MKNRAILIHGWNGRPEGGWRPWLKKELEEKGWQVLVPAMPGADQPRIEPWVDKISEAVGEANENTFLVGHSMGCQAIARYLERLPESKIVGGAIFVAGFFDEVTGIEDDPEDQETMKHWMEAPIDLGKVKPHMKKSVAILSDNDPYVPLSNREGFEEGLGSEVVVMSKMGHFSGSMDGVRELPIVLEKLVEMAG
jgi:hypothetical protein